MEMSRGLLAVLALLSLGVCSDLAGVYAGGWARWIWLSLCIGRIAAIFGILTQTEKGYRAAMGFFLAVFGLNAWVASQVQTPGVLIGLLIPLVCVGILYANRHEFRER